MSDGADRTVLGHVGVGQDAGTGQRYYFSAGHPAAGQQHAAGYESAGAARPQNSAFQSAARYTSTNPLTNWFKSQHWYLKNALGHPSGACINPGCGAGVDRFCFDCPGRRDAS